MDRTRTLLTVAVVVLVALAGCASFGGDAGGAAGGGGDGGEAMSGDGGDGGGGDAAAATDGADPAAGTDGGDGDGGGTTGGSQQAVSGQPLQVDREIIRTGTVELRVEDFEGARSAIADRARRLGGYVSGSASTHHTRENESWTTGYVVVRVPSDRFSDVLAHARDRGTVLDEQTETRDVTDKLVDLDARLTNLKERRQRLRSFYERANSTGELLRIEEELASVQSEIERLEAKKRSLEDRVAFATLRVEIREPEPERQETPEQAGASLVSAFLGSMATLRDLAYGLVLFAARLGPFVLFVGLPALAVGLVARRGVGGSLPWRSDTDRTQETGDSPNGEQPEDHHPGDGDDEAGTPDEDGPAEGSDTPDGT